MAKGTTSTTPKAMKQYWMDRFVDNLYLNLALKGLTKRGTVPNNNGTVCWWTQVQKVDPVGAALTEGADPTARSSRATRYSATLKTYGNLVTNSSLLMDTAIDGVKETIMDDLAKDAAKTLDDTALSSALGGSNVLFGGASTHRSNIVNASTATVKLVRKAVRLLKISGVPTYSDGFYVGLCHPDVSFDLMTDSAWTDLSKYRDSVKFNITGEIGKMYGVRFVEAPSIPILVNSGSASADVYRTLVMGPNFLGQADLGNLNLVMNEPSKSGELGLTCSYGYTFTTAFARLSEASCIRLETTASLGNNN